MKRIVLLVPDLLGDPEQESALRQKLPTLNRIAETADIFKIAPLPEIETREALYLGLRPSEAQMRQGPLTVSALGADPPERSTQFHLSLMSLGDGEVRRPEFLPTPEELRSVMDQALRLNTRSLTVLRGEELDHGLVWESLGDLHTVSAEAAAGQPLGAVLPEGDGEPILRRFIDDSVNLLMELELNERRLDQGLPPLNLLWPWGHGTRTKVPNLLLWRGELATVESASLRMQGLTRLSGYRHEERSAVGRGVNTRLRPLSERALGREISIILLEAFSELRSRQQLEEVGWLAAELDREMLQPIFEAAGRAPLHLALLAPSTQKGVGLGLEWRSESLADNFLPFDERALEERRLSQGDLWQRVESGVSL